MVGITPFEFDLPTRLVFGEGVARQVGAEARKLGATRVMVVADPGVVRAGLAERLTDSLEAAGVSIGIFDDVVSNPRGDAMDRLATQVRDGGFQLLVGVGGGSGMDTAKGAAMLATNGGSILEYTNDMITRPSLPVIAVPTTAGTGAEMTGTISLSHPDKMKKVSVRSLLCRPAIALADPEMLAGLPANMAAWSGMDALSHAVESYLSLLASPFTEMFGLRAMTLLADNLERFVEDRKDVEAARATMLASVLAGISISYAVAVQGHGLAIPIGGRYDLHHGYVCGILLAPVMRFNMEVREQKLGDVARALGASTDGLNTREAAEKAVEAVDGLRARLGLPADFKQLQTTSEDLEAIARGAQAMKLPSPRKSTYEETLALARQVL